MSSLELAHNYKVTVQTVMYNGLLLQGPKFYGTARYVISMIVESLINKKNFYYISLDTIKKLRTQ